MHMVWVCVSMRVSHRAVCLEELPKYARLPRPGLGLGVLPVGDTGGLGSFFLPAGDMRELGVIA